MRFSAEQYDAAIEALKSAKTQLQPDGQNCPICGDSGHMAWECGHNPLLAMRMCVEINDAADAMHDRLHYLSGHCQQFGVMVGPAAIHLPTGGI